MSTPPKPLSEIEEQLVLSDPPAGGESKELVLSERRESKDSRPGLKSPSGEFAQLASFSLE